MRRILTEERDALDRGAGKVADQIAADRLVHIAGLKIIAAARAARPWLAAMIPFVHVEGPFIAAADGPRGAHPGLPRTRPGRPPARHSLPGVLEQGGR